VAFAPNVLEVELPERAWLLLCSHGLRNYAEATGEMAELVAAAEGESALEACRRLVAFANAGGGHDSISDALLGCRTPLIAAHLSPNTAARAALRRARW
jgi:serine/threonine protein phosphatase PrpC